MQVEQEACNEVECLFEILNNKFRLQYNETIKSLQLYKLVKQQNESTEEWMGRLRMATIECSYKEVDRQLKGQFKHRLNDSEMLTEIIRELTRSNESIMIPSK